MTDYGEGAWGLSGPNAGPAIFRDAKVLEEIMGKAISTSPGSFTTTLVDIASKKANDWVHEIQSSTWVVAERDGKGIGVAACKPPSRAGTKSPVTTRVTLNLYRLILISAGVGWASGWSGI